MRPGYAERQLHKASVVALRSRDPSTKCGAVIVRPDKSVCSEGYNGFPSTMEDREEWYNDRSEKYPRVIHAEMNALRHTREDVTGYAMFITRPPCSECAKHIAAWGVAEVVWSDHSERKLTSVERIDVARSKRTLADCDVMMTVVRK